MSADISAPSPSSPSTSESILIGLQRQTPSAWVCFVRIYGPLVYSWCRRRGLSPEDSADLVQEVSRAVHRRIDEFSHRGRGSFRGWLWTITRNKIRDFYKTRSAGAVGGSGHLEAINQFAAPTEEDSPEPTEPSDRLALLRRALDLIQAGTEPHSWTAFWRSAVDGHTARQIAADLNMTPDAVRKARSRILQRLRTAFHDLGEELTPQNLVDIPVAEASGTDGDSPE